MWPSSWNSRSFRRTTVCPRRMSGAVGSTPRSTRSDDRRASLRCKRADGQGVDGVASQPSGLLGGVVGGSGKRSSSVHRGSIGPDANLPAAVLPPQAPPRPNGRGRAARTCSRPVTTATETMPSRSAGPPPRPSSSACPTTMNSHPSVPIRSAPAPFAPPRRAPGRRDRGPDQTEGHASSGCCSILVGFGALAIVSTLFGTPMAVASDLPQIENRRQFQEPRTTPTCMTRCGVRSGIFAPPNHVVIDT